MRVDLKIVGKGTISTTCEEPWPRREGEAAFCSKGASMSLPPACPLRRRRRRLASAEKDPLRGPMDGSSRRPLNNLTRARLCRVRSNGVGCGMVLSLSLSLSLALSTGPGTNLAVCCAQTKKNDGRAGAKHALPCPKKIYINPHPQWVVLIPPPSPFQENSSQPCMIRRTRAASPSDRRGGVVRAVGNAAAASAVAAVGAASFSSCFRDANAAATSSSSGL
jgi:hypothetical protein